MDLSGTTCFEPVRYRLEFTPRETCWRYLVAGRSAPVEAEGLRIVTADGDDAGFTLEPTPHRMPDGRPALCLAGRTPRALLARPNTPLSLVGSSANAPGRIRTLVERLPAPGPDSLVPRQAIGGAAAPPAWSDIYVFV